MTYPSRLPDPEEELIRLLGPEPEHIRDMLTRRALRMILGAEVRPEDELMFNNWRKSKGLKPLDENNQAVDQ